MNLMSFENWPYKWFGIFQTEDGEEEGVPRFGDFVDKGWNPEDKSKILDYLKSSPNVLVSSSMSTPCLVCGAEAGDPGSFYSDGEWLWPERLLHYMTEHDVRLPNEFVQHIRDANYKVAFKFGGDIGSLPWPEI